MAVCIVLKSLLETSLIKLCYVIEEEAFDKIIEFEPYIINKITEIHLSKVVLQSQTEEMHKKLSELETGEKAVIVSLEDEELVLKLMEMGFLPGEEISVEQIAPLGDPISVMISGYQVSLRINEAESIIVEI